MTSGVTVMPVPVDNVVENDCDEPAEPSLFARLCAAPEPQVHTFLMLRVKTKTIFRVYTYTRWAVIVYIILGIFMVDKGWGLLKQVKQDGAADSAYLPDTPHALCTHAKISP